jgi:predicted DNA-binding protein
MKEREQILLEPSQKKRLQAESDQTGVPKTEIVRRALDRYFNEKEIAITLMSEPALAKDWMRPEEDEAWSDL